MDTNIANRVEIQIGDQEEALSQGPADLSEDRLKVFRAIEPEEELGTDRHVTKPVKKGRRNGLMIGSSSVAVLAAAAGVFWISPYNHYTLQDAAALTSNVRSALLNTMPKPATPIAPAAQLARAPAPMPTVGPYRPQQAGVQSATVGDDMAEFLRLGGQGAPLGSVTGSLAAPAKPAQLAASPLPAPVVSPRQEANGLASPPLTASLSQPKVSQAEHLPAPLVDAAKPKPLMAPEPVTIPVKAPIEASVAASAPPVPRDAAIKIAELRPAPMTEPQQLQVLQLVTELGTLVRDQRSEIAQLRQDQQNLGQRVDGSLTDFGRRLSLAEARGAVAAAMGVQTAPIQPAAVSPPPVNAVLSPIMIKASAPVVVPTEAIPHRYHIQAASPGLAMLSALDASGGEEQQLPVTPGDVVPGWGKVVSISQRGATWVVKTDHGLIQ